MPKVSGHSWLNDQLDAPDESQEGQTVGMAILRSFHRSSAGVCVAAKAQDRLGAAPTARQVVL